MSLGNPPQVWSLRPRPQGIAGSRSSFAQNGTGFFTNGRKLVEFEPALIHLTNCRGFCGAQANRQGDSFIG